MSSDDVAYRGTPGRTWGDLPKVLARLDETARPIPASNRIPVDEVQESNALMQRLGLRTRYRADGTAYLL